MDLDWGWKKACPEPANESLTHGLILKRYTVVVSRIIVTQKFPPFLLGAYDQKYVLIIYREVVVVPTV